MLAYSAIAQIGFMLLALTAGVVSGNTLSAGNAYSSALFYMVVYVLTTLGTFGLIMLLSRQGFECDEISDLAGLNQRSPWMAGVMAVFMFSLAGIPPTAGFYAKLAVLQALITTNQQHHLWLAVFAVLVSLIGAFYYLRIVKLMYFDEPAGDSAAPSQEASGANALLAANGAAVLLLGILPGGLDGVVQHGDPARAGHMTDDDAHLREVQVSSERIWQGRFLDVRRDIGGAAQRRAGHARVHRAQRRRRRGADPGRWPPGHGAPVPLPDGPRDARVSGRQDRRR